MKRAFVVCGIALLAACHRGGGALAIPAGSQVVVHETNGATVSGTLVDSNRDRVVLRDDTGNRTDIRRANIASVSAIPLPPGDRPRGTDPIVGTSGTARVHDVTIPAGTVLPIDLETPVGSDISHVEEPVRGRLRAPVRIDGIEVLPEGAEVRGDVIAAERPGRVEGRGYLAIRFTELDMPGTGATPIRVQPVAETAPATKGTDAIEILAPAAGAAVLGRLVGGKGGARVGAVAGGAAGTGYVLATRGKDVRLGKGARLSLKLTEPVMVKMR